MALALAGIAPAFASQLQEHRYTILRKGSEVEDIVTWWINP